MSRVTGSSVSNMGSMCVAAPPEVAAAFDALDAAVARIGELNLDNYAPGVRLHALERLETARRRQMVSSHDLIAGLAKEDPADVGGPVQKVIADWLRISCAEARRRMRDAEQLAPRVTMTGETLPPELPATAQAWRTGVLDQQHLRVIQTFVRDLPVDTPVDTVERAERFLAQQAAKLRPDQLEKVANRCAVMINPDGKFSDLDRARHRGFTWSAQRSDGMSVGKLVASPELRANLDAWLARFAAPGMCNPDDQNPCVTGEPDQDLASKDSAATPSANTMPLNALVRGQLGDPKLGVHNGLPVTVIVSTTLQELSAARRAGRDRRRDTAAHARPHPHGRPCLPLPGSVRRAPKSSIVFGPFPSNSLSRSARGPLREGSGLHCPRLRRPGILDRSPSHRRLGPRRPDGHRQVDAGLQTRPQASR